MNEISINDVNRIDAVYNALLDSLELDSCHSDDLLIKRGLSDTTIARNLYASVPTKQKGKEIAEHLSKSYELEGVAGFYFEKGSWHLNINYEGFYIPYRDAQGLIRALQIRCSNNPQTKYLWLSSKDKPKGASPKMPLHYVNPDIIKERKEVLITEGALKADVAADLFQEGLGIVAFSGVNIFNPEKLFAELVESFPDLEDVIVAFDADFRTNEVVKISLHNLIKFLSEKKLSVRAMTWDEHYGKGIDDVLLNTISMDLFKSFEVEEFEKTFMNDVSQEHISVSETFDENEVCINQPENLEKDILVAEKEITVDEEKSINSLVYSWGEFSSLSFNNSEKVIFGLSRGNVGLLIAPTNIGKTTLTLNLALSVSGRREFLPLFSQAYTANRVLYIDGESTKSELKTDIEKMLNKFSVLEIEQVEKNLFFICDAEINDEMIDLAIDEHLREIKQKALDIKPDLIVIDTFSALINVEDENDNAEIKSKVLQPLKQLAKETNSAILLLHHTGKYNEGSPQAIDSYKGRGASAFGCLARTTLNLKPQGRNSNLVTLSCSKVKGERFETISMKLDKESRWFEIIENSTNVTNSNDNYEQLIKFVKSKDKPVKRSEIDKALSPLSVANITRMLNLASKIGDLLKPSYGFYSHKNSSKTSSNQDLGLDE
jgi:AAA domain/Domain of unknown function (DUF3854)